MNNKTVYLNGQYLPLSDAKVSVLDRGFLFGDGVYEVIPCYSGKLFYFDLHINRLNNSLAGIRLPLSYTARQWQDIFTPLLDNEKNQYIYLQVTRGVAAKRDHAFPESVTPTIFAMSSDIVPLIDCQAGVKAITLDDNRWELCNIKAITLLGNILLRQQAVELGCAEALLIKDGMVIEGAASNIFAVIDGVLLTPPNSNRILPGITREVILQLAQSNQIPCREQSITLAELKTATEIWVTSSIREILPITELDGLAVANGKPGELWHTMNKIFQDHKQSL
jgi:D-alanine transaminase